MALTNTVFGVLAAWFLYWQLRPLFGVRRLSVAAFQERLRAGGVQVVDVRTPGEYAAGHIPDSLSIPLDRLRREVDRIARDREVVLVCRSGYRAMQAYHILKRRRFQRLWVLEGGMVAFMRAAAEAAWAQEGS
ncbi:MAG: rhodanese-like domain-containing protein [Firmicutes bacterium]|nr:rhodanese-like domain-containing protein [Alicyclobacillaceae bacterium]MCL6496762.1 rhodanese-like domain-containing protein [Bacillota bacterium]